MTALYTRHGRRYVEPTPAELAREVMRRSDWRDAVLSALADHPDLVCRECEGRDGGGRYLEVGRGGWIWQGCEACGEVRRT